MKQYVWHQNSIFAFLCKSPSPMVSDAVMLVHVDVKCILHHIKQWFLSNGTHPQAVYC